MKHYIVYVKGIEVKMIQAGGFNAAEKKAQKLYPHVPPFEISVTYTEV